MQLPTFTDRPKTLSAAMPQTDAEWLDLMTDQLIIAFEELGTPVVVLRRGTFQPMGMFDIGAAPIMDLIGFYFSLSFAPGETAFRHAWVVRLYDDEKGFFDPEETAKVAAASLHKSRTQSIDKGEVMKRDLN